jgi:hypothetical protein
MEQGAWSVEHGAWSKGRRAVGGEMGDRNKANKLPTDPRKNQFAEHRPTAA